MLLPFLSGLAQGGAEQYAKISDEKRKQKADTDKIMSGVILKSMEDPDLTPDQHLALQDEYFKRMGVDKKTADYLKQHSVAFRNAHDEEMRKQQTQQSQAAIGPMVEGGAAPLTDAQTPQGSGLGDIPTNTGAPATRTLPEMPNFKPQTMGELATPGIVARATALDKAKNDTAEEARTKQLQTEHNFKLGKVKEIQAQLDNKEITEAEAEQQMQLLGVKPQKAGGTGASTWMPATISGEELKARYKAEGKSQAEIDAIDEKGQYRVAVDPTKTKTVNAFKVMGNTFQGKSAPGANFISQFQTDYFGNAIDPKGAYYPVLNRAGGSVVSVMPEGLTNTEAVQNKFITARQADGTDAVIPVQTNTQTNRTITGPAVAPPVPTLGTPNAPASAAPAPGAPEVAPPVPGMPKPAAGKGKGAAAKVMGGPITIGHNAFTPKEVQDNRQLFEALDTTADRVKQVLDNAEVFNSLVSTGKISAATSDSVVPQILSRGSKMTDQEAHVAALMTSLKEDINVLRKVYAATGFRGPEAFSALTALAGKPWTDPRVLTSVLRQTLESLSSQEKQIQAGLKEHDLEAPVSRLEKKKLSADEVDKILHGAK